MDVLITEGGDGESRAAVAAVRSLHRAGHRASVTETDSWSLAGRSRWCARRVEVPKADVDPVGYASAVGAELARRDYLTLLAASDAALLALEAPVRHLLDKVSAAERATTAGLAVPPTEVFASGAALVSAARRLPYPVVAKPALKTFAATVLRTGTDAAGLAEREGAILVQPWLDDRLHGVVGVVHHGELVGATHLRYERIWPTPCGTISAATTVEADADLERSLLALLDGYEGLFHVDLAGPHLLDVNPRIHASLPAADAAGAPLVGLWCQLVSGERPQPVRGRAGVRFRFLEGDLRSIWFGLRRGEIRPSQALAALAPKRGTVHSYASVGDPGPAVARARLAAARLFRRG